MAYLKLHSLEENPNIPREYLYVDVSQEPSKRGELNIQAGSYEELEHHLGGILVGNVWMRVMDKIVACNEEGQYCRFSDPHNNTILVVRTYVSNIEKAVRNSK